eukprot:CAMPEP_0171091792 /NCGR_PEP_ID=MMETSP0766_2-20121228/35325_1 /TAXON_ID=439317 /ORGANISM="Gambierdiscus australes, Strain CAWD 149" /LENGTH=98 /DNA_ID=CAMNT_0011549957 /DNA_START=153 /DNA_END=449 /DNA_ORIENTATION=+
MAFLKQAEHTSSVAELEKQQKDEEGPSCSEGLLGSLTCCAAGVRFSSNSSSLCSSTRVSVGPVPALHQLPPQLAQLSAFFVQAVLPWKDEPCAAMALV